MARSTTRIRIPIRGDSSRSTSRPSTQWPPSNCTYPTRKGRYSSTDSDPAYGGDLGRTDCEVHVHRLPVVGSCAVLVSTEPHCEHELAGGKAIEPQEPQLDVRSTTPLVSV